jgi:dipeptidyl aminopeptidase/acylaminoacyl peptidase
LIRYVLLAAAAASLLVSVNQPADETQRPITVEDCVRTKRIIDGEVKIAPDGSQFAYIVKAPNTATNRNNHRLYVRDLKDMDHRENGHLLIQADKLSGIHWLGSEKILVLVEKDEVPGSENHTSQLEMVDAKSGSAQTIDLPNSTADYSLSADGTTVVYSEMVSDTQDPLERSDKAKDERGYRIPYGGEASNNNPLEYAIYSGKISETGKIDSTRMKFTGPGNLPLGTTLQGVRSLNLSPDGRHLLLMFASDWVPPGWEEQPVIQQLRSFGVGGNRYVMGLCDVATGQMRLAFNFPAAEMGWSTWWADDGQSYAVVSASPFGTPEAAAEGKAAQAFGSIFFYLLRFNHIFTVDARTGAVEKALDRDTGEPGNAKFSSDGPLSWHQSHGEMIVRATDRSFARLAWQDHSWKELGRLEFAQAGRFESSIVSNGQLLVAVSQAPMIPPDLSAMNVQTGQTVVLTDLNPEYREIALGQTEDVSWTNRYGSKASGVLIKPVGYKEGIRYPLIFMATSLDNNSFVADTPYTTAFAPQPLANAGFLVLLCKYADDNKVPEGAFPGEMGDAFNWMSMVESAIDFLSNRGIADKGNVGIAGFSRTSWLTDFTLTHSAYDFKAASSADGGAYTYESYFIFNNRVSVEASDTQIGGPPYGKTLKYWLEYAPPFQADKVRCPVLMEYTDTAQHGFEFFVALNRLGIPAEMYRYPKGAHPLDTPFERVASLQRNVDWFRFWMQGYERPNPEDPEQYVRWRAMRSKYESNGKAPSAN